jgi:hypothetical protein
MNYIATVETHQTHDSILCPYSEMARNLRGNKTFYLAEHGSWVTFEEDGSLNKGLSKYLKGHDPWQPIYFDTEEEALSRAKDWIKQIQPDIFGSKLTPKAKEIMKAR